MPVRYDRSELRKPERTREGFLRVDAHPTRVGIQEYRFKSGKVQRELRPESEVFHADSLASIKLAAVTLGHPREPVTPKTWKRDSVGIVGQDVQPDGDKVRATIEVKDESALKAVDSGTRELSGGYTCDLVHTPGEWNGQKYDAIQTNIRVNHVAIVPKGRGGPEVRMHLDDAGDELLDDEERLDDDEDENEVQRRDRTPNAGALVKKKIGGVEYEVTDQVGQALDRQDAQNEVISGEVKQARERADAAVKAAEEMKTKLAELEKTRADAADPKKVAAAVKARVSLLEQVRLHLDAKEIEKLDGSTDRELRVAALAKLSPAFKADGKSDDAIEAAFEMAVALKPTKRSDGADVRRAAFGIPIGATRTQDELDPDEKALVKMVEDNQNAWKFDAKTTAA